jgi:D-alanine-D-alanine ligase
MLKIAVLYGGGFSESDVSKDSADAVVAALKELKYEVFPVEYSDNFAIDILSIKPDVVFNAMHGKMGEDGVVPAMLDAMRIKYTHSGCKASAICMNKNVTYLMAKTLDVIVSDYFLYQEHRDLTEQEQKILAEPFVVKPNAEGSSVGVEIIEKNKSYNLKDYKFEHGPAIIQKYVKGRELSVAIVADKAVGIVELQPKVKFYDYKAKYTEGVTKYIIPAKLSKKDSEFLCKQAEKLHKELGCKYISRVDYILTEGKFHFLEINTHPGFTKLSLTPKIALKCKKIKFNDIIKGLVESASYTE